jgi:hypothetical protein
MEQPMVTAAIVASALLGVTMLFQIGLALGAPWGAAAWGGRHRGVLPTRLRAASALVAVLVYPALALMILVNAGVIEMPGLPVVGRAAMWALTGLFALGALANFISPSRVERLWGLVSAAIAVCCGLIAVGV